MVEILGSSMENRSPFQESTFVLEETGVMELLKSQACVQILSLGPICTLILKNEWLDKHVQ